MLAASSVSHLNPQTNPLSHAFFQRFYEGENRSPETIIVLFIIIQWSRIRALDLNFKDILCVLWVITVFYGFPRNFPWEVPLSASVLITPGWKLLSKKPMFILCWSCPFCSANFPTRCYQLLWHLCRISPLTPQAEWKIRNHMEAFEWCCDGGGPFIYSSSIDDYTLFIKI